jgi:TPP-dependent pyruvate/acetoin dehydrogenase alpha subunit
LGSSVLFVCENNLYAMGTAIRYPIQWPKLKKRSCLRYWSGSGGRMESNGSNRCRRYRCPKVRSTGKPYLLVCNTYQAHSMFDAELYRDQRDWRWKKKRSHSDIQNYLLKQNGLPQMKS